MEVFNWIDRFRNKQIRRTAEGEQMEIRLRWFRLRWKMLDVLDKRGEMEMEMTGRRRKRRSRSSSEDLTVDAWFKHGDGVRLRLMICFRNPQKTQREISSICCDFWSKDIFYPLRLCPRNSFNSARFQTNGSKQRVHHRWDLTQFNHQHLTGLLGIFRLWRRGGLTATMPLLS